MGKIKIDYKDLEKKSTKQLVEMQVNIKRLISKNPKHMDTGNLDKGRNPKQERRNLARISQILNNRMNKIKQ